jgi:transposase
MDSHTDSVLDRLEVVETGRRRRWSEGEKERIVLESMAGPRQISATARRHGIARSQLLAWRRSMLSEAAPPTPVFVPAVIAPEPAMASPASALPAPPRIEIALRSGRRIIIEGGIDMEAVLKLAKGLEALR